MPHHNSYRVLALNNTNKHKHYKLLIILTVII